MIAQNIVIPVEGLAMDAYLARPEEGSGRHPAVIVLQEVFGVNAEMRRITDLVASAGYVGIAINYYHRTHPNLDVAYDEAGHKIGMEAAKSISRKTFLADIRATVAWLETQPFYASGKVATWGFCMGGSIAFISATLPEISGAICFYGGSIAREFMSGDPEGLADVEAIRAPVLLCFGAEDKGIPAQTIARIKAALDTAGVEYEIQVYADVGHAFFRHGSARAVSEQREFSDEAVAHAVADSWNLVQSFLARCFHPERVASS